MRAQKHHDPSNISWLAQSLPRVFVFQLSCASQNINQPVCEFGRKETWCNDVGRNVARSQLHRKAPADVVCGGLRTIVHDGTMVTDVSDVDAAGRAYDDNSRGILSRAGLCKQGCESVMSRIIAL